MEPKPAVVKPHTRVWVYPVGVAVVSLISFQYAPAFDVPALAVPALFLAVDSVICHVDMLMTKHPNRALQGTPGSRSDRILATRGPASLS